MANNNTYNAASIILIFAALFGIISFFSGWFIMNPEIGFDGPNLVINGYGMLDGEWKGFFDGNAYIPLFVAILSIITLIIAFLPKLGVNVPAPRYSVMLVILGLAIFALTIVYGLGFYEPEFIQHIAVGGAKGFEHAGAGVWFAIISGLLTVFIGALPALTKKV